MKVAVLSMDVEDWYHLDYFDRRQCDTSRSMLDGLDVYVEFLQERRLSSTFFVLGELAEPLSTRLRQLASWGHDIGSHGWDHQRPLQLSLQEFRQDALRSRDVLQTVTGQTIGGYRAPCFSLDRPRLDILAELGYQYDSSRIEFGDHPLYGTIDMHGFWEVVPAVFHRENFFEFEVSTLPMLGRRIPVSGGGYLRLIPWPLMSRWVKQFGTSASLYVLYIHPFELSHHPVPPLPKGTPWLTRVRFSHGRSQVLNRLAALVDQLETSGFRFTTFSALREAMIHGTEGALA